MASDLTPPGSQGKPPLDPLRRAGELFVSLPDDASLADRIARARSLTEHEPEAVRAHLLQMVQHYEDTDSHEDNTLGSALWRFKEPEAIGPYRILGKLGTGGFGVVFKAIDTRPDEHGTYKTVAIKLLPITDSKEWGRRFDDEVRAIKRQRTSKFAPQLHEIGRDGITPYIVMEFVDGKPFLEYTGQLPPIEQLRLFCQLCDGVQEMHTKMTIHRDLKDSNILVDAAGTPRILDYGIARLLSLDDERITRHTMTGSRVGSLHAMSPEQLRGERDIDARTDVFALGVLLFQLLAGTLPRPASTETSSSIAPATLADIEPLRLSKVRPGSPADLDAICAKAMDLDPVRRYATAQALADDIRRYLASEPVSAVPPSKVYRTRKFLRKNRLLVSMVSVALLAVSSGILVAQKAAREQRMLREAASKSEAKAVQVAKVLKDMLAGVQPLVAKGRDTVLLEELLDNVRTQLDRGDLSSQPDAEYELRLILSDSYNFISKAHSGLKVGEANLTLIAKHWPDDSQRLAEALARTAESNRLLLNLEISLRDASRVLELRDANPASTLDHRIHAMAAKAAVLTMLQRHEEALTLSQRQLELREQQGNPISVAHERIGVANALLQLGRFPEALQQSTKSVEEFRSNGGEDHPSMGAALYNHALALDNAGRLEEALLALDDSLARESKLFDPQFPWNLRARFYRCKLLSRLDRNEEALTNAASLLELARTAPPAENSPLPEALRHATEFARNQNNHALALTYCIENIAACSDLRIRPIQPNLDLSNALSNAAQTARRLGKHDQSVPWAQQALDAATQLAGPAGDSNQYVIWAYFQLAFCQHAAGLSEIGKLNYDKSLQLAQQHMPEDAGARKRIEAGFIERTYP
jgi:eukaryotic-like serine/threonine-protein kinase